MKNFSSLKLKYQIAIIIGIAILLIIILESYYYIQFLRVINRQAEEYANNTINQLEENLNLSVNNIKKAGNTIAYNNYVQEYLKEDYNLRKVELYNIASGMMEYVINSSIDIIDIALIDSHQHLKSFYSYLDINIYQKINSKSNDNLYELKNPLFSSVVKKYEGEKSVYYLYLLPVYDTDMESEPGRVIGQLVVLSEANNLQNIFEKVDTANSSEFMVVDKKNMIIASNQKNYVGEIYANNITDGQKNGVIKREKIVKNLDWKIIYNSDRKELTSELSFIKNSIFIIGIIMIIMLLLIGVILNKKITEPIIEMLNSMQKIGDQHLKHILDIPEDGEISIVARQINRMLDKIEKLTQNEIKMHKKLYNIKLSKKQAELSALQSQVNPHFLYNTLECIRSIAFSYQSKEIISIATAMAKIFRYSIKGENFVLVREEIEIIKEYLKIMNIRFANKFKIKLEIDEEILDNKIIRMSLQPLIENAIYHGLEPKKDEGELNIRGYEEENKIIFRISDNGKGIEENKLINLRANLKNKIDDVFAAEGGLGLVNINQRIKLFFGNEYGLKLFSRQNKGTLVEVILPDSI